MPKKLKKEEGLPKTPAVIAGGRIIDPASGVDKTGDIYLENGKIARLEFSKLLSKKSIQSLGPHKVLDASGQVVSPGFIDLHVHLREPGREDEETIVSGTMAAAAGGFTSICCMPNTDPPLDNQENIRFVLEQAKAGFARVYPLGCVTQGRKGEKIAEIGDLFAAGAVAVTDDGQPVMDASVMRLAFEYSRMFGMPIVQHAEDTNLSHGGIMHEGLVSTVLGMRGIPAAAEEIIIARDLKLLESFGGRLHVAHISTAGALELVRQAKAKKLPVTCEVTPHHLTLTDEEIKKSFNPNLRVNPPLRSRKDVEALREGLVDGAIDAIATDHAPHSREEKEVEFDAAPNGMIGLETAFGIVMTEIVAKGYLSLAQAIEKLTAGPARVFGLPGGQLKVGHTADITIFDTNQPWTYRAAKGFSKSINSPFDGWNFKGKVVSTLLAGRVVYPFDVKPEAAGLYPQDKIKLKVAGRKKQRKR
ncbi:MAG: dihydroorotase [candidate division Zixibacteria bacterium]|nr:dihydroorotase [candidate division Zixibacteria bacterium]